jgi:hypothetical protein
MVFTFLSCLSVASYFDTSKPKIASEKTSLLVKPSVDLKKNYHYPILFFLEDESKYLNWTEVQRYFHVSFYYLGFVLKEDGSEEGIKIDLKFVPCKELIARGKFDTFKAESEGFVKSNYEKFGFCVDDEGKELTLGGESPTKTYETLGLYFSPCSLTDGTCKNAEELKNIGFLIANPAASLSLGNYKHPVRYITEQLDFDHLISDFYQTRVVNLVSNKILEDRGHLFPTKVTQSFTSLQIEETKVAPRDKSQTTCVDPDALDCIPYFALNFMLTNSQILITREYKGVVELIGEIGGTVKAVVAIFSLIYNIYYSSVKSKEFVRMIYGFHSKSPNDLKPLANRLRKEMDILRIIRELKVLKFLVLKSNLKLPMLKQEDLIEETKDIFEYLDESNGSGSLLIHRPTQGQTVPLALNQINRQKDPPIFDQNDLSSSKEYLNQGNQSLVANKVIRKNTSMQPKAPAALFVEKPNSRDTSKPDANKEASIMCVSIDELQ